MNIEEYKEKIIQFCQKWLILEFAVFGSVLRDDFSESSDVDVLVTLPDNSPWSLFDWVEMIEELKDIFGREVDMIEKSGLRNPYRRKAILESMKVIYQE